MVKVLEKDFLSTVFAYGLVLAIFSVYMVVSSQTALDCNKLVTLANDQEALKFAQDYFTENPSARLVDEE